MGRRPTVKEKQEWVKSLLYDGRTVPEVSEITKISPSTIRKIKEEDIADFWIRHELEWESARKKINGNRERTIRNSENCTKRSYRQAGHCG